MNAKDDAERHEGDVLEQLAAKNATRPARSGNERERCAAGTHASSSSAATTTTEIAMGQSGDRTAQITRTSRRRPRQPSHATGEVNVYLGYNIF